MHRPTAKFWLRYRRLPQGVQDRADKAFELLQENPRHPSLQFKKIGAFWSVRVDIAHRALAVQDGEDFVWVWIGSHDEYERMIQRR